MSDERTPLLQFPDSGYSNSTNASVDEHLYAQFCHLVGIKPLNLPPGQKYTPHPESLYQRATNHRWNQNATYLFSATITNTLLLSQVVLGAALTGLGASDSSRVLITVFGALNTVIAGVIAFVKSRGQPMRARMFRDDLERVVDEIENSAVMWMGISHGAHGYDAIDTDDQVTVRSEVARLTRLYDKAVKTNTMNDPDMYSSGNPNDAYNAATRSRRQSRPGTAPAVSAPASAPATLPVAASTVVPVALDPDESPATKAPETAQTDDGKNGFKGGEKGAAAKPQLPLATGSSKDDKPAIPTADGAKAGDKGANSDPPTKADAAHDPDASPAIAARPENLIKVDDDEGDEREDSAETLKIGGGLKKENVKPGS